MSGNSSGEMAPSCLSMFFRVDRKKEPKSWAGASPFPNIFPLQNVWLRGPCALSPSPIIPTLMCVMEWQLQTPPACPVKKESGKTASMGGHWTATVCVPEAKRKDCPTTSHEKSGFFFKAACQLYKGKEKLWILLFGVAVQIRLTQCTRLPVEREARCAQQTSHNDTVRAAGTYLRDEACGSLTQRLSLHYKTIAELKETHKRERRAQMQL